MDKFLCSNIDGWDGNYRPLPFFDLRLISIFVIEDYYEAKIDNYRSSIS